jgi:glycosyltransferase involved in cell wall biosynthesis
MFDYKFYTSLYPDLSHIKTEKNAHAHWIKYGKNEGRICSKDQIKNLIASDLDLKTEEYILEQVKTTMSNNLYEKNINSHSLQNKINIYYYVQYTSSVHQYYTSGIQRTVRLLCSNMYSKVANLFLIKRNDSTKNLEKLTFDEVKIIEKLCNIKYNDKEIDFTLPNKWIFIPEFCLAPNFISDFFPIAKKYNMKIACLFYDDIILNPSLFTLSTRESCKSYLKNLLSGEIDIIFPISKYSTSRLLYNMYKMNCKIKNTKIIPCVLPGEFFGYSRILEYKVNNPANKYQILCVSTITRRKNQISLIKAVNILKQKYDIKLMLVATTYEGEDYYDEIKKLIGENNETVKVNINISNEELKELYMASHLTVFPSIEEGFGLPIVESIWNCRPCICMNYGSMKEVATAGCVTIDCNNVNELANTIEHVLTDKELQNKLINEIINAKIKTWDDYANEIVYYLEKF